MENDLKPGISPGKMALTPKSASVDIHKIQWIQS